MMQLPGGVVENGVRRREWAFRQVSGSLELAVAEAGEAAASTPAAVTQALSLALNNIGGEAATPERVANLCVADRQFLMRELELHLGHSGGWFQVCCGHCQASFDFHLDYADLPVQEAGADYPLARVNVADHYLEFRLPNGADQAVLVTLSDADIRPWLLQQLAQQPIAVGELGMETIAAIESGLEAISPGIIVQVQATCPDCGADNDVDLDPYRALSRGSDSLIQEVHQIAVNYHWSEAEILAMPRGRRQRYLQLIDRSRGMVI